MHPCNLPTFCSNSRIRRSRGSSLAPGSLAFVRPQPVASTNTTVAVLPRVPLPEPSHSGSSSSVLKPVAGTLPSNGPIFVSVFRTSPSPFAEECPNSDCLNLGAQSTQLFCSDLDILCQNHAVLARPRRWRALSWNQQTLNLRKKKRPFRHYTELNIRDGDNTPSEGRLLSGVTLALAYFPEGTRRRSSSKKFSRSVT